MKPRYDEMTKTLNMLEKTETTGEGRTPMVEHKGKKVPHFAADDKGANDQTGKKVYKACFGMQPNNIAFDIETGGQTRNMFYYTNQATLDSTDVANKGATTSSVNMEGLADRMNTHQTGTQDREVSTDNTQPDRD